MKQLQIVQRPERQLYGVWGPSNEKTQARDIPDVSKRYYQTVDKRSGEVLPFYVVSRGFDEKTKTFLLFIGGEASGAGLDTLTLPAGIYAQMTVRPKLGFLWGAAIGETKRYFYTKWLPTSPYRAMNMEFELHTEKSLGWNGSVELLFSIEKK